MTAEIYKRQAALLVRVLPLLRDEKALALKGGTAINLFVRDMPRLSVDIDLTYLPIEDRATSLSGISAAIDRIGDGVAKKLGLKIHRAKRKGTQDTAKVVVSSLDASIKLEPNEVLRGAVYPTETRELSKRAAQEFEASVRVECLSLADLYGGKLCAALDRQHPRDLFDVKLLLENEGFTHDILNAFVVYLASHSRTMHELLRPTKKPLKQNFENDFAGMTVVEVSLKELEATRDQMVKTLNESLNGSQREFLISMKSLEPDFSLLGLPGVERLPGIQWKLQNLRKLKADDPARHQRHVAALKKAIQS